MQQRKKHHDENQPTAVVIGGGIAGLLAARELAAASVSVTVLEAAPVFGGCIGVHEVAGLVLDSGAESFATRSSAISDLAGELGLGAALVDPNPAGAWVQLPEGAKPLPKTGVLGIPADPWDPDVRRTLGFWGALRAGMDRLLPAGVGTAAELSSVADLVRARMGPTVLNRLVAPVVGGVHSADPALLDVDMVAPGLRELVAEKGSLAEAVTHLRAGARAGSAVGGLAGGMHTLVAALTSSLRSSGVELRADMRVTSVEYGANSAAAAGTASGGGRAVEPGVDDGGDSGDSANLYAAKAANPKTGALRTIALRAQGRARPMPAPRWRIHTADDVWTADALVVATEGRTAADLLSSALPELAQFKPAPGPAVKLVTLVLDMPELDAPSRGTGILVAPQTPGIQAKALTHATAKWRWLADDAGPGTHVLRLSYGRSADGDGAAERTPEPQTDEELLDAAVSDAAALLGVHITAADLLGWDVVRWEGALPFAAVGHRAQVARARKAAAELPGFAMVGSWLAGTGLVAVAADAIHAGRALAEAVVAESAVVEHGAGEPAKESTDAPPVEKPDAPGIPGGPESEPQQQRRRTSGKRSKTEDLA